MAKGIIYVMETVVDGLVKIGKTETTRFDKRMRELEKNGYRNVGGLKRRFAIEIDNYDEKEYLLHRLFSRSQVSNAELFSLNVEEVIQLLSSFDGEVVFPKQEKKSDIFKNATDVVESKDIPDGEYTLCSMPRRGQSSKIEAKMQVKCGKMTVLKGATLGSVNSITVSSWKEFRNNLKTKNDTTTEDFNASSPSMAASVILGRNSNGWTTWKNAAGKPIDIYRKHTENEDEDAE